MFFSCYKPFLLLTYLRFCPEFLKSFRKQLHKKAKVNFRFMTSQTETQTIKINLFPNISKSKDNQKIKFSLLIESNIRNIFLQNLR